MTDRSASTLHKLYQNGLALAYIVPYTPSTTDLEALMGAPCDGVQVGTDDYRICYAGPGGTKDTRPGTQVGATPTTVGAGWTDNLDGTYTHTPGSTAALVWDALVVGAGNLIKYTVSGRTAGEVTAYAGTNAGATNNTNAAFRELNNAVTDGTFSFVPDTNFDGTISLVEVLPGSPPMKAGQMYPIQCSRIEALVDDTGGEASAGVFLCWYRKPAGVAG